MKNRNYFYGQPLIDEHDIEAVCSTLESNFLSQGTKLFEFEDRIAEYCGAKYCVALSNGTAALHMACKVLGLGSGDIGWTSALSFVASANCIRYCGASVDFVDIDLDSFNVLPEGIKEKFSQAERENNLPGVIIPVHFAGQSCDMREIKKIADQFNCKIIEDACHALGGKYEDKKVGCCQYSDIAVFSLHPVKSITTGEGGMILTNNKEIYERVKIMRTHGMIKGKDNRFPWDVEMITEGFNFKITEFQCALGINQLKKLDYFIEKRTCLAQRYKDNLKGLPVQFQKPLKKAISSWHLLVVLIDFAEISKSKIDVFTELQEKKITLGVHYKPIHLHQFYRKSGFREGMFRNSEGYYEKAFSLPLHPRLELDDIDYICEQFWNVII